MIRRNFLKGLSSLSAISLLKPTDVAASTPELVINDRTYWIEMLTRISFPVLDALSKNKLKESMPVECIAGALEGRKKVTYLEALGRTLAGLAPWLELGPDNTEEGKKRKQFIELSISSIKNAVDPSSGSFMNFTEEKQPLVDAAFLAHALIRAPKQLWGNLDGTTKQQLVNALISTRVIKPYPSNWLLFSAMVEAALFKFSRKDYDPTPVDYAIAQHEAWYKGDGVYGDGPELHVDYYNSFVIQPMILDVLATVNENSPKRNEIIAPYEIRSKRYAEIQERLISPEGTFPPTGRSIAYRCGAFQLLGQMALQKKLPDSLPSEQVRSAMTGMIKKSLEAPNTFDKDGWLTIGFCGHQPEIGETYISTGSLYLCTVAFLPLGLPADDPFWSNPLMEWTSKKAYSGKSFPIDKAIH
ncbi:MAG TPA: DUF2264 domain-containing protein [Chryseolinea sp.]|nr:DUF2264 domain-containing protein [Chryseolinea sp.]HPH46698.1 DUF2264 domain-containing protein [Chryseolinea sp.]HPM28796.1 DUF2264 domain-containing protein [Chryseolinea sp.]